MTTELLNSLKDDDYPVVTGVSKLIFDLLFDRFGKKKPLRNRCDSLLLSPFGGWQSLSIAAQFAFALLRSLYHRALECRKFNKSLNRVSV